MYIIFKQPWFVLCDVASLLIVPKEAFCNGPTFLSKAVRSWVWVSLGAALC